MAYAGCSSRGLGRATCNRQGRGWLCILFSMPGMLHTSHLHAQLCHCIAAMSLCCWVKNLLKDVQFSSHAMAGCKAPARAHPHERRPRHVAPRQRHFETSCQSTAAPAPGAGIMLSMQADLVVCLPSPLARISDKAPSTALGLASFNPPFCIKPWSNNGSQECYAHSPARA